MESQSCPICLLLFNKEKEDKCILPCSHIICNSCINEFIKYSNICPMCNSSFTSFQLPSNEKRELTNEELENILNKKKADKENETFDCITRKDIARQIIRIERKYMDISLKLFPPRNQIGNEKEEKVLDSVKQNIFEIKELLFCDEFDGKNIVKNLNEAILELQKLENREYLNYHSDSEEDEKNDDGFQIQFDINAIVQESGNKHKKKKKRKK
ncbi:MAG: RING finger protein [archaeon]|nr:RING finger protein [archaeon]